MTSDGPLSPKHALVLLKYRPVCICNTIRYPRVKEAIDRGARTVEEVAKATGCTTGECRGERCLPVIRALLAEPNPP
ncbi:MAG TPA: (2Fe-2S)-binding protein [Thermoanaerobaculia bacterium]|nr:(2Fe-2S)-binding protein [Thermoanaerobaculia bacterium]HQR68061.1 (2Fe-2S)-binding protein [Thermoanaerobaculia bacterium]